MNESEIIEMGDEMERIGLVKITGPNNDKTIELTKRGKDWLLGLQTTTTPDSSDVDAALTTKKKRIKSAKVRREKVLDCLTHKICPDCGKALRREYVGEYQQRFLGLGSERVGTIAISRCSACGFTKRIDLREIDEEYRAHRNFLAFSRGTM